MLTKQEILAKYAEALAGADRIRWAENVSWWGCAVYADHATFADDPETDAQLVADIADNIAGDVGTARGSPVDRAERNRIERGIRNRLKKNEEYLHGRHGRASICRVRRQPKEYEREPTTAERAYLRTNIGRGAAICAEAGARESAALPKLSPQPVSRKPAEMAASLLRTLAAYAEALGVREPKFWTGSRYDTYDPTRIRTADEWEKAWLAERDEEREEVPEFVSVNPMTGEGVETVDSKGRPCKSYRKKECVAVRIFTLIEFDRLPLKAQADFWLGNMTDGDINVVSLVYTGGKSIHALVVVPHVAALMGSEENYRAAWGCVEPTKDNQDVVVHTWGELSRHVMSDTDGAFKSDPANAHGIIARLPGHLRAETKRMQRLLWLADLPNVGKSVTAPEKANVREGRKEEDVDPVLRMIREAFPLKMTVAEFEILHPPKSPHVRDVLRWIDLEHPEDIDAYARKYIYHTEIIPEWIERRFRARVSI